MKKLILLLTFSVFAPFALGACGGEGNEEENATAQGTDEAAGTVARPLPGADESPARGSGHAAASVPGMPGPSISVRTFTDGQTAPGSAVTVSVSVKGFQIVDQRVRPPFPPPEAGQGHVHLYLDTETLPTTHSPPSTGAYRSIARTTYTWTGVSPGTHSFAAQLVGKDHVPLNPPVKDRITVDVE